MSAANLGGLLVAAALLAKSGLFGDALPGAPGEPKKLSFTEWQNQIESFGSRLDYEDYLKGY